MRRVEPKVYLVARPSIDSAGMEAYLRHAGAPDWLTNHAAREPEARDGETLVEFMGRLCYRSWAPALNANVTKVREDSTVYLGNILKSKHGSVLEHANYSFVFADVSRVFTHELVRHRAGCAYSQESLRFVRLTDLGLWLPPSETDPVLIQMFEQTFRDLEQLQKKMAEMFDLDNPAVAFSQKKVLTSLMRRLAPEGLATCIGMTANVRALRHMLAMRTSPHAEAEIAVAFRQVAKIMKAEAPALFQDMTVEAGVALFDHEKV